MGSCFSRETNGVRTRPRGGDLQDYHQVAPVNMPASCAICDAMPHGDKCEVCKAVEEGNQAVAQGRQPDNRASSQENEVPDHREGAEESLAAHLEDLYTKMSRLLAFLLLKFGSKELTTKEEMLRTVLNNDEENFQFIFSKVSECLQLIFGVDVREVNPEVQSFTLVTTVGLTYDGMVSPDQPIPNTGLLVIVLGVIMLADGCISEVDMWRVLSLLGVYPGREHFIYGEPRSLLTHRWVQQQYLEYRQVPGSDPAVYQFCWGPRARNETNRERILEVLLIPYNSSCRTRFPDVINRATSQENEVPDHREGAEESLAAHLEHLYTKMPKLLAFLLLKFGRKELTTKEQMLRTVLNNDEENFQFIFSKVSECLQLIFGVDVREVNPEVQSFTLVTTVGLTYDGMVSPDQPIPNTGLLVIVLGVIMLADGCISEVDMCRVLSLLGVYPRREHFIYGEPSGLFSHVWVQQQYLEYRQVPGSDPAVYQFRLGPRARSETNRERILEVLLIPYNSECRPFLTIPNASQIGRGGGALSP